MARKSDLDHHSTSPNPSNIETIGLHNQTSLLSCDVFTYQNTTTPSNTHHIIDNCDVSDPLLFTEEDQPPSYIDVITGQNTGMNLNEPPPPYTSREVLNVPDDKNETEN